MDHYSVKPVGLRVGHDGAVLDYHDAHAYEHALTLNHRFIHE
jgi:hypothetical protein